MSAGAYDFSCVGSIVDNGGGHGQLVISLLLEYPSLTGLVFDWPAVVDGAREAAIRAGVEERCDEIGGDLFEGVPSGADLYLHDWPDEHVIEALTIVRDAMSDPARLLVIYYLLPQPGDESAAAPRRSSMI